jgi:hypothetical protein
MSANELCELAMGVNPSYRHQAEPIFQSLYEECRKVAQTHKCSMEFNGMLDPTVQKLFSERNFTVFFRDAGTGETVIIPVGTTSKRPVKTVISWI